MPAFVVIGFSVNKSQRSKSASGAVRPRQAALLCIKCARGTYTTRARRFYFTCSDLPGTASLLAEFRNA